MNKSDLEHLLSELKQALTYEKLLQGKERDLNFQKLLKQQIDDIENKLSGGENAN
jgi:hypothetical protein